MNTLKIEYLPNQAQKDFHASPSIHKWMVGTFGSGKTATGCVEGILQSIEHGGNVGLVARKSLPELKSTTFKRFFEYLPDHLVIDYKKVDRELYLRSSSGTPSLIHFGPLDDIGRYKSLELGWFFIDEGDEMTEDIFDVLIGRLRLKNVPKFGMIASNPTTVHHWLYKRFIENPTQGMSVFRSKTEDNRHNLPNGYIEQLKESYKNRPDWIKRYLDGEFGTIQRGDPGFPDFRQNLHVKPLQLLKGIPILRGWDFGYHHPCVIFCQFDDRQRFRILSTIKGHDEDLEPFADRVIRYSNQNFYNEKFEDYCDPAGVQKKDTGKSSILTLNDKRIYPKYRSSLIEERACEIRKLMRQSIGGEPCFLIDPQNTYGIEALTETQYEKQKDGMMADHLYKDGYYDHFIDCIGYIVANTCMMSGNEKELTDFEIKEPKWSYISNLKPYG